MPKKQGVQPNTVDLTKLNTVRAGHNYLMEVKKGNYAIDDLNHLNGYLNTVTNPATHPKNSYKVGVLFVCINQNYWQYATPVIDGIRQFFLPGHQTEIMMWSDLCQYPESKHVTFGADKVFETESVGWPYPTLMRYHMFLEQEEYLKQFDYLFYVDLDMRIVNIVGDEILGNGLTAAPHPGYYIDRKFIPPYEPNPNSAAYIRRPGYIATDEGKPRFIPFYAAGGFQGGRTQDFIDAMKSMRDGINADFDDNYVAIWNDESHWNKYLFEHPADIHLDPSYVYPDSLINEYYVPRVWGRDYTPRIITITKPFSLQKLTPEEAKQLSIPT